MILPVLEVQAVAQVGAKQGGSAAAGNNKGSFSMAFGESLRQSAQTAAGGASAAKDAADGTATEAKASGLQAAKLAATRPLSNAQISLVEANSETASLGSNLGLSVGASAGSGKGSAGLVAKAPDTLAAVQGQAAKANKTSVGISAGVGVGTKAGAVNSSNLVEAAAAIEDAVGDVSTKANDGAGLFENADANVPANGNATAVAAGVLKTASSGGASGGISLPAGLVGKITEPFLPVKLEGTTATKLVNATGKSAAVKGAAELGGSSEASVLPGNVPSQLLFAPDSLGTAVHGAVVLPVATVPAGFTGEAKQAEPTGDPHTGVVPAPIAAGAGGGAVRVTEAAANEVAGASVAGQIQTATNVLDGATAAALTAAATALNTDTRAAASQSQAVGRSGVAATSSAISAVQNAVGSSGAAGGASAPGPGLPQSSPPGATASTPSEDGLVKTGQAQRTDQAQATRTTADTSMGTKLGGNAGSLAIGLTVPTPGVETPGAQITSSPALTDQGLPVASALNLVAQNLNGKRPLAEGPIAKNVVLPGPAAKNLVAQSAAARSASPVSRSGTLTASGTPLTAAGLSQTSFGEPVKVAAEQPGEAGSRQPQQGVAGQSSTRQAGSRESSTASSTVENSAAANGRGSANAGANNLAASPSSTMLAHDGSAASTATVAIASTGAVASVAANSETVVHAAGSAVGVSAAFSGLTGAAQGVREVAGAGSSTASGAAGAGNGSAESAARLDSSAISEPHRTLVATPTMLEVGVPDGTQGWLRIRAEVGEQGQVNASLTGPTSASQEMLHRELPALNAYLHSEQMAVTATVSDRSLTGAAQGGLSDSSVRNSTSDGMMHGGAAGGQAGGGQTSGQTDPGRQGAAASVDSASLSAVPQSDLPQRDAARGYDGNAGLSETSSRSVAASAVSGESGQWLNVSA